MKGREPDDPTVDTTSSPSRGLCGSCRHARAITSGRGSVFSLCQLSSIDPTFPRYPRLPVVRCRGYEPVDRAPDGSGHLSGLS
jgi:hypothetical protein